MTQCKKVDTIDVNNLWRVYAKKTTNCYFQGINHILELIVVITVSGGSWLFSRGHLVNVEHFHSGINSISTRSSTNRQSMVWLLCKLKICNLIKMSHASADGSICRRSKEYFGTDKLF